MLENKIRAIGVIVAFTFFNTFAAAKPLKVFIMAGQSNMQGKARVKTIERLTLTEDSKQLYQDMAVKDGMPSAVKDVYGVYFGGGEVPVQGPLQPGYGATMSPGTNFGPDYTFSIYMQKHLNEPFLIIKTAWGGKDLMTQFRPPSAGPLAGVEKARKGEPIGHYYNLVIQHTNEVLADPGKYHPAYNKADGYEIAGFVWFQGFNDLISDAYLTDKNNRRGPKDFSEYSRLLACFIRDVRKELKAPKMPFVIGVVGFDGPIENAEDNQNRFRKAQEAPASLPEFAGNVVAVRAENCWDMEWTRISKKVYDAAEKKVRASNPNMKRITFEKVMGNEIKAMASEVLTPEELKIYQVGKANEAFHYLGSAYIYGNIGKIMAEGMSKMLK